MECIRWACSLALGIWGNFIEKAASHLSPEAWVENSHVKEATAWNTETSSARIHLLWLFLFLIAPAQICTCAAHLGFVGSFKCKCVLHKCLIV